MQSICVFGGMKPRSLNDSLAHSGWANPVSSALYRGPFTVPHHQHNLLFLVIPLAQLRHTLHAQASIQMHLNITLTLHSQMKTHKQGETGHPAKSEAKYPHHIKNA